MQENKITTYLLYAIGEIALVVIGILIAVSIDNWNENRKTLQSINEHLVILEQNLQEDQAQLRLLKANMSVSKNAADSLMQQIMTLAPVDENTSKYLTSLLLEFQFRPNKNAMETITQAGEIPFLSQKLQKAILDYYAMIERAKEREEISNNQIRSRYEIYINNSYEYIFQKSNKWEFFKEIYKDDPRKIIPFDQVKFITDKRLEALIASRQYQTKELNNLYNQLSSSCQKLLQHINDELTGK